MDLFSIIGAVWRHKLAAIPVIVVVALGAFYVVKLKAPVYQASASVLFVNPPAAPTASQLAANPGLAKISPENPYVNFGSLPVVADVVISVVTSAAGQQALVAAGADPRYQVALSPAPDSPPIIEITGVGATAQEAVNTANLVSAATKADLYQMQKQQGVNSLYMIKSIELVRPVQAQLSVSGKLRTLIAVLGLGVVLLFVFISAAEALEKRRMTHSGPAGAATGIHPADVGGEGPARAQPPRSGPAHAVPDHGTARTRAGGP
jgi:capsular polysaccharide biosynthesis protein